jgi:hypothetical protein
LEVAHLIAPAPQTKGKIQRRFGTFQRRLVALMAHAMVETWAQADEILQMEIQRQNRKRLRSTGKVPLEVGEQQILARSAPLRPAPAATLPDLHFSLCGHPAKSSSVTSGDLRASMMKSLPQNANQ